MPKVCDRCQKEALEFRSLSPDKIEVCKRCWEVEQVERYVQMTNVQTFKSIPRTSYDFNKTISIMKTQGNQQENIGKPFVRKKW